MANPDEFTPGAVPVDGGVRFGALSQHAERIDVVIFDASGDRETARHAMQRSEDGRHSLFIDGIEPGARYGLRATGPYDPCKGLLFDPSKLLVDPYAAQIDRPFRYAPALTAHGTDTAGLVPRAIVTKATSDGAAVAPPVFDPGGLIYELAVKPFTMLHPGVREDRRGTIAALSEPAVLDHLTALGVSAVELMPINAWIDERHLGPLGLTNGWGYNPVSTMALDPRLAPGGLADLQAAVKALHSAGIGVFVDVVFNHTGEGDRDGPTLSLRGLDNSVYYRHEADDPGLPVNDTGCGNTLACERPAVQRLILDSMRHFVRAAGIDGFRFDLAPVLGRDGTGFSPDAALFAAMRDDAVLKDRILIAEPWDIGPDGYQLGAFPDPFFEWNDRYRDDIRRFWRGDAKAAGGLATRLAGSADLFRTNGRTQTRTVNFIAAHDGFTLADLVSYETKHNTANGEDNADGHDDNLSWNNGAEGETANPAIEEARAADIKALLATLFASRGPIMLTAGDEFGRTQDGNNNAYAQDNRLTWLDWENRDRAIEAHAMRWSALRRLHRPLRDPAFLDGRTGGAERADVLWLDCRGVRIEDDAWAGAEAIAMVLADTGDTGRTAVLFNRTREPADFTLPAPPPDLRWQRVDRGETDRTATVSDTGVIHVPPRTVALAVTMHDNDGRQTGAARHD